MLRLQSPLLLAQYLSSFNNFSLFFPWIHMEIRKVQKKNQNISAMLSINQSVTFYNENTEDVKQGEIQKELCFV